jgi:hypothetical protein
MERRVFGSLYNLSGPIDLNIDQKAGDERGAGFFNEINSCCPG